MAQVTMLKMDGTEAGNIELKDDIFGIEVNQNAVHAVIVNYLANQRQGTQSAKTRGDVRGGGRKPFRQKRHRPRQTGKQHIPQPDWRRSRICTQAQRLQIHPSQEAETLSDEISSFLKGRGEGNHST